jgi:putative serine protease PepD
MTESTPDASAAQPEPLSDATAPSSPGATASSAEPATTPVTPATTPAAAPAASATPPAPPVGAPIEATGTPAPTASSATAAPPTAAGPATSPASAPSGTVPPTFSGPAAAPAPEAHAPARRSSAVPIVAALAVGALVGGGAGAGVAAWAVSSQFGQSQTTMSSPQSITVNNPDSVTNVTAVAAKAAPSIVTISASSSAAGGTGSGIILSDDGYVLTNTHVVTLDGETNDAALEVTTSDGTIYQATVVGTDPTVDLAVIKLTDASGLTPIEVGSSGDLNVGDQTVVIGAPLGLSNSVSDGIVSALNRGIRIQSSAAPDSTTEQDQQEGGDAPFDFWQFDQGDGGDGQTPQTPQTPTPSAATNAISLPVIQTDAAVNPGNSGGALLDSDGKLIGVIVAIAGTGSTSAGTQSGSIGVGFAIPVDLADRVAREIIDTGSASHALLGATVRDATSEDSTTVGAVIDEISSGEAAEAAGLQAGDVVTALGGIPITNSTDLTAQVRALAPDSTVDIAYQRDGAAKTATVTLGTLQ